LKHALIAILKWTLTGLAVALAVVYTGDYLLIRRKMTNQQDDKAFGNVQFFNATALKNDKVQIFFDQPQTETCLHSLFPHFGYRPCWYASRQDIRMIGRLDPRPRPITNRAIAIQEYQPGADKQYATLPGDSGGRDPSAHRSI
jgi:hypothetical protein